MVEQAGVKKYGDRRPALVTNSPKRNTCSSTAKRIKSWRKSLIGHPQFQFCHAGAGKNGDSIAWRLLLPRIISATSTALLGHAKRLFRLVGRPARRRGVRETLGPARRPDRAHARPTACKAGFTAEKKAIAAWACTRREPDRLDIGLGIADIDAEGRYLRADFGALTRGVIIPAVRLQLGRPSAGEV